MTTTQATSLIQTLLGGPSNLAGLVGPQTQQSYNGGFSALKSYYIDQPAVLLDLKQAGFSEYIAENIDDETSGKLLSTLNSIQNLFPKDPSVNTKNADPILSAVTSGVTVPTAGSPVSNPGSYLDLFA